MKKYLTAYPELLAEWHPTKNNDLNPEKLTHGSSRNVWWECENGHEWQAIIANRVKRNSKCEYCSGRKPSKENNLKVKRPDIVMDWDYEKNELAPELYAVHSNKEVFWKCAKGHEYTVKINSRTTFNSGCPYCANIKTSVENSIAILFPDLASYFDLEKNYPLTTEEVAPNSNKKVWWKCENGHEFQRVVRDTTPELICPICTDKKVHKDYNLAVLHAALAEEFDRIKNGEVKADQLSPRTPRKVWWKCKKGHSYKASVAKRVTRNDGCPYCSGQRLTYEFSLEAKFPDIAMEWDYEKNFKKTPSDVHAGSNAKFWWLCNKHESYLATPNSRTGGGTGCPKCTHHSSRGELRILSELQTLFSDVRSRHKIDGIELDVYVPELCLGIEFDGAYWHENKTKKDLKKNSLMRERGIEVLRVREAPLKKLNPHDVIVGKEIAKEDVNHILVSITKIFANLGLAFDNYINREIFSNDGQYRSYIDAFPEPIMQNSLLGELPGLAKLWDHDRNAPLLPHQFSRGSNDEVFWVCEKGHSFKRKISSAVRSYKKNPKFCQICQEKVFHPSLSLSTKRPQLAMEWHPSLNGDLSPQDINYNSYYNVFWKCPSGHKYDMPIRKRTVEGRNCPFCSGRRTAPERSLAAKFPQISSEWHPFKNDPIRPEDVTYGSGKRVWWLCAAGHEWESRITDRTTVTSRYKGSCPICSDSRQSN